MLLAGPGLLGCQKTPLDRPSSGVSPRFGPGIDLVTHVLNRCTLGIRPGDREAVQRLGGDPFQSTRAWIAQQLEPGELKDEAEAVVRRFGSQSEPPGELYEYKERVLLRELTAATILRGVWSTRQLREVVVHFWSDHFNIDISKGDCRWLKVADDRDVIRRFCLGRFEDLLRASALSPAMLWYLDGRVNRRASRDERPNENYARELLELHTLGVRGGYTQRDVMEVARCLTGWTVRGRGGFRKGVVEFRPELHDDGPKQVLSHPIEAGLGPRDLDRVLEILVAHPSTASHLALKLCRRFIADDPPSAAVREVASAFSASRGHIGDTLRTLFARPEFLAESAEFAGLRGAKLKRPFHFLVSALRAINARTDPGGELTRYLTSMGQALFQCPTPDGYPEEGGHWCHTLLWRWNLAARLASNQVRGTTIDLQALEHSVGGPEALMSHLLGRRPKEDELAAWSKCGGGEIGLALLLASPAFQRF